MNNVSNGSSPKSSEANPYLKSKISKLSYAWNPTSHLFVKDRKTWRESAEARVHCLAISIICVPMCLWNGILVPTAIILCFAKQTSTVYIWITSSNSYNRSKAKASSRFAYNEIANMNQIKGHFVKCVAYLIGTLAIIGIMFPKQAKTLHEKLGLIQQISILNNIRNVSKDVFHLMANSYLDLSDYSSLMKTCSALKYEGNKSLMKWKANSFATDKTIKKYNLFLERVFLFPDANQEKISLKEIQEKTFTTFGEVREFEVFYHKSMYSKFIKNLNSLKIYMNTNEPIQNDQIALNSPNLKFLQFDITNNSNQGSYYLNLFSTHCRNLESLSIKFNNWNSSFYEISKFYNLKYLEFIDFSYDMNSSYSFNFDSCISSIAMCPKLEKITFKFHNPHQNWRHYSYQSYDYRDLKLFLDVLDRVKKCPELKEIEIFGVTKNDYDIFQLLEYSTIKNIYINDRYEIFQGIMLYNISILFANSSPN